MVRRFLIVMLATLGLCQVAAAKPAEGLSPKAVVQTLYEGYMAVKPDDYSDPLDGFSLEDHMTPDLYRLYYVGSTANTVDEVPILDWDPFINGQDFDIKSVTVTAKSIDATHQVVTAIFNNSGIDCKVLYDFVLTEAGWRMDNLKYAQSDDYPEGFNLKAHIQAHLKDIVPDEPEEDTES